MSSRAARRKLTRARMDLVLEHPFFGAMALRLAPEEDPDCADLWTDGVRLGFNPLAVERLDEPKLAAVLAHEILHLACEHHLRRGDREKTLWNRACDLAVNGLLAEAGFALPRDYPVDKALSGRPAEAIYARLLGAREERAGDARDGALAEPVQAEGGAGGAGGATPSEGVSRAPRPAPGGDSAQAGAQRRAAPGGNGQGGAGTSGERDAPLPGEVRDHPDLEGGPGAPSGAELSARLRQAVHQSLRGAPGMGELPAGLLRHLGLLARPRLPWRELLRRFVLERAVNDYSWTPPSRRHIHAGLYLPSPRSMGLGDVVLAVDTSGSVGQALLESFLAELSAVLEACDARLLLLFCDAAASGPVELSRLDPPPSLSPSGGGGTDYRPVFQQVEREGLRPACLIYLTDLQCDRYPAEPPYPVLWAAPEEARGEPPFGELVRLS